jgi:hypothetical protein
MHRANLIGMDVPSLRLPESRHANTIRIAPRDRIEIDPDFAALAVRGCD